MKPVSFWTFFAYREEKFYPKDPFIVRVFFDHGDMKNFSAKISARFKKYYPNLVSTYVKGEIE
jgi:hypothetical protein